MCANCGCGEYTAAIITNLETGGHIHLPPFPHSEPSPKHAEPRPEHDHDHHGHHHHDHPGVGGAPARVIRPEQAILSKNDRIAERNRGWFSGRHIAALNMMSSPGAGKTTLLERTIRDLGAKEKFYVIEGDQATLRDGERIRSAGAPVAQINTGAGCHLDAKMISAALGQLQPAAGSLVIIENVGNLVCPALFDLGEQARVVIASVTEGDDKPLKYPHMFRSADVIILNKMDLLSHVPFDLASFKRRAHELNPEAICFQLSATRGTGLEEWYQWLTQLKTNSTAN